MATLHLSFLGRFQALLDETPVTTFRTNKVQALVIYLAAEGAEPQRRETLMELLWPGMPERSARHNLRQALYYLRLSVPEVSANGLPLESSELDKSDTALVPLVLANRQTIQLNPRAAVQVDVRRFSHLIATWQAHEHLDLLTCSTCRETLEEAIALYRGDFLADFYLDDSNEFEEWAESKRYSYRRKALDALETLTSMKMRQKAYPEAQTHAEQQLEIDNLRESAYRQLMEILALNGRREEALAVYENCRDLMAQELGMAPTKRTTEIYELILAGDLRFDEQQPQGIRGYELQEEIGEGAYGTIYRAVQPSINRDVAVKVILRKYANDPEFIRRFEAEAQTIAHLEHPYIVPLYDYWREPEGAYLVMRFLRGGDLLSALEQGPWDLDETVQLLDQVSSAVATAHHHGIVHRDIKPANILFDESGNAFLSDFGIAKNQGQDLAYTAEEAFIGTPDYTSPEQLRNEPVTQQADIYSLGAVLYETLTGEKPFSDDPFPVRIQKHLSEPLPLVRSSRPDLPFEIDEVIQKATAKQPKDRYPDALAMAEAFRSAVQGDKSPYASYPLAVPASLEISNPYKGLRAFQESDASDFFGREIFVQQLATRLAESPFLALVGPSGSGKSSLVKAGLVPALRQEMLPGSDKWFFAEMVPGTHPLEELELALLPIAVDPPPSLVEPMQKDERGMLRTIRRILPAEEDAHLLLLIDQFEELFTLVDDEQRRLHFLNSLLAAINSPRSPLHVVITLRADFYDRPLQIPQLA
ncbi:MAG: protein kinase, partial [Candidatus Promineifilaceae bacterium]|nr:protein kinase [Candidatus Promineifilaceae bacterium]